MTTLLYALAVVGLTVFAFTAALVAFLVASVHLDNRAAAKRRAEQGRQVDAAYIASLAADPAETTQMFDRLLCEQIEKAEGWA